MQGAGLKSVVQPGFQGARSFGPQVACSYITFLPPFAKKRLLRMSDGEAVFCFGAWAIIHQGPGTLQSGRKNSLQGSVNQNLYTRF